MIEWSKNDSHPEINQDGLQSLEEWKKNHSGYKKYYFPDDIDLQEEVHAQFDISTH